MTAKAWVLSGRVYLKLPYGKFDKTLFPKTTRYFDFEKKAWVVDLNVTGRTVEERYRIYKAARVLKENYYEILPPEGRHLISAVLATEQRDKPYEFYIQSNTFYFSARFNTPLYSLASAFLKRQGSVFYAGLNTDRFSNFISSIPLQVKEEIAKEVKRKLLISHNEERRQMENEIRAKYPFLFDFQVEGAAFLAYKKFAVLGDVMGVGKTIQALCAGDYLMSKGRARKVIVFAPSAVKSEWYYHVTSPRFLGKEKNEAIVLAGGPEKRKALLNNRSARFIILNYELVLRDFESLQNLCKDAFVIIDEASRLKNRKAKTHKLIKQLIRISAGASALTGTPVENGPEDFFSIATLLGLKIRTNTWKKFLNTYCITKPYLITGKRKSFYIDLIVGYKNLHHFKQELAPYFLRRTLSEVSDLLPELRIVTLETPLDPVQKKAEDILFRYIFFLYGEEKRTIGELKAEQNILARMNIATIVEDSPLLLKNSSSEIAQKIWGYIKKKIPDSYVSPKESELLSALYQTEASVLIFTKYAAMAERLYSLLRERLKNKRIYVVTGKVSNIQKDKIIGEFQRNEGSVLIATDTLAYGKNIQGASVIINFDLLWNPKKLEQRQARIRRIGSRKEKVLAVNIISEGIETLVAQTLKYKLDIFAELVETPTEKRKNTANLRQALKNFLISRERKRFVHINT